MSRNWARSLRGRVTLVTTLVAAVLLIPFGVGAVTVTRAWVAASVSRDTRNTAERIAAETRTGALWRGGRIPVLDPTVPLIQVVNPQGTISAASDGAASMPRLSDVWPTPDDRVVTSRPCVPGMCLFMTAVRVSLEPDSSVVYAGRRTPAVLADHTLETVAAIEIAILIGITGWATWMIMGRALRPVAAMRAQLDEINASDLSRRVMQPGGDDELSGLAASINGTLARLERSARQQRQFASDASHELRTPIAGLRAQLESAQLYPDDTDLDALVTGALRDTDRLEAIITDLLLLARIGSRVDDAAKEWVDLGALVREELTVRKDRVPIRLAVEDGVVVLGVRLQLARLLTNLLDNAERHADRYVRVSVGSEDGTAVLAVENDGAEIAEEDRERIFERFTRLDAARSRDAGGTGLGLAIARDVAVAHGGELTVEDCQGGARFVLRLPSAALPKSP
ncbi:sensor histidine kinase [Nonomuraea roseoviolacea]|uniref:histidine kinase n=1 Tax=Nonomuraea roseoviolacea subsp. carminata TaxID=160689 RepID=A0ABT1KF61_9ACTN|nr:HAMP domain-containing sensor histidine kinase [Nonomuraea roseoviolacea]MCP2352658.1 signal transduction histidine kinase [Nonomuraea roseoviolacea subsp. carminata]